MEEHIIYPKGVNDLQIQFNRFIENNPQVEIISVNCSCPLINKSIKSKKKFFLSILYN